MKTAVIYTSSTGFTKRYATWITDDLQADLFDLKEAKTADFSDYDVLIYGGWAKAGLITGFSWFKKQIPLWQGKKLAAFCVGASPADNPDIEKSLSQNLDDSLQDRIAMFYFPGGLNYEAMPAASRLAMKLFSKMVQSRKNETESEKVMAKMIGQSYDISSRSAIEPLIDWAKSAF